ncbi:MAG: YkgJ family cysteine cluster protein [Planctomycetes bacterium]|nr:YkgJ family cysteine cluster protein [Planctomycetota bacterium]
MPEPWYHAGLKFRCLGAECGDCCSGKNGSGAVWVNAPEMLDLAKHLGLPFDEFTRKYVRQIGERYSLVEKPNFDCVFYEAGKGCTVYEARPTQCRTYPFWNKVMAAKEYWKLEAKACPGIGADETVVTGEEIARNVVEDRRRFPEGRQGI